MARITVEDCLDKIPNRFELALAAAYRARQLAQGSTPKVDSRDKPTVTALREVADGAVGRTSRRLRRSVAGVSLLPRAVRCRATHRGVSVRR